MPVMLIARFDGDVGKLKEAYDRGHAEIMRRGGAVRFGELRHHCAASPDALFIIGVWDSEEHARSRWASEEFKSLLASFGFPSAPTEVTFLDLHAVEPPLPAGEALQSNETEEFLKYMLPKQIVAERAIHAGDVEPRLALWSHRDPVTLLGAKLSGKGWADLDAKFRTVASWFSDTTSYEFEVIAAGASGDLAYIVGNEHNVVKMDGVPRRYTLRSTHVYRREGGEWKIVHRHADQPPAPDVQIGVPAR